MRIFATLLLCLFPPLLLAETCDDLSDPDAAYARFTELAYEPRIEQGQVVEYRLIKLPPERQQAALDCIQRAIALGHWESAYTLSWYYRSGSGALGIAQDRELADHYLAIFEAGQAEAARR